MITNSNTFKQHKDTLLQLEERYQRELLDHTIPFWLPRSIDTEYGGYFTCYDQDGTLLQEDKSVWFQGRMAWMFSTLYLTVEKRQEWLDAAATGIQFLNDFCFDTDGRMFFSVTRDGKPLRKRRYVFSECFAVIALAAYSKASGDQRFVQKAEDLFSRTLHYLKTPGLLEPKVNPSTRPMKGLATPMILLVTAQELRKYSDSPQCQEVINQSINEIEKDFLKPEFKALLECVGPNGEFMDTLDGRCVNPGHSIEAGWFILEEARMRNGCPKLLSLGKTIIDWSLDLGWDKDFGGLFYFRDAKGKPCVEYWHDMKFWWPHNEALIATLLAYESTGEAQYLNRHLEISDWCQKHFADTPNGEWFGYLHRDGKLSTTAIGTMFKGFFHLPRQQWHCWQRLKAMNQMVEDEVQ